MSSNKISRAKALGATFAVALVVAAGLAGLFMLTTPHSEPAAKQAARVLPVAVTQARLQSGYALTREFVGRVEARRESAVGFELGGLVVELLAEEGDNVDRGQIIGRLDTARLEVRLKQLRGRRAALTADIELARATRVRQETLAKQGHASHQRYDEARFQEQALLGRLQELDAEIDSVALDIEKSVLKAPFAAIVGKRLIDEGIVAAAGAPAFELLERINPEARIGVAGQLIDAIAVGQRHDLIVRGRAVPAIVRSILPVRDRGTRSVDVILTLQASFNGIRRGDLARLEIERPIADPGFWLPLTALTESSRGLWAVYVAADGPDGGKTLERRELEVLHQEADRVFARGTLADHEQIVVAGRHRLVPGQSVQITKIDDTALSVAREMDQ